MNPLDQIDWDAVLTAFSSGLFVWSVGVGIGLIISIVRKVR